MVTDVNENKRMSFGAIILASICAGMIIGFCMEAFTLTGGTFILLGAMIGAVVGCILALRSWRKSCGRQ